MAGKKDLERLRRRKRRKQNIIRATVHFFVWAGVAVLYYVGFSLFFDTPVEYELKHSTDRLRREYAALTQRYDSLTTVMHNLSERDRNVFRILFESDPYDFDSEYERKQAATYENIFNRSSRRLKLELRERVADMEKRLDELNASYPIYDKLTLSGAVEAGLGCGVCVPACPKGGFFIFARCMPGCPVAWVLCAACLIFGCLPGFGGR